MKNFIFILSIAVMAFSCDSGKSAMQGESSDPEAKNDTIHILNEDLEYEITIIEPGFHSWMITQKPRGFYGLEYLENKNRIFTTEYNSRVLNSRYSTILYPQEIHYDPNIRYGYEVNYLLYNYFIFFKEKYKQRF
jgi:hypothetical protein